MSKDAHLFGWLLFKDKIVLYFNHYVNEGLQNILPLACIMKGQAQGPECVDGKPAVSVGSEKGIGLHKPVYDEIER